MCERLSESLIKMFQYKLSKCKNWDTGTGLVLSWPRHIFKNIIEMYQLQGPQSNFEIGGGGGGGGGHR